RNPRLAAPRRNWRKFVGAAHRPLCGKVVRLNSPLATAGKGDVGPHAVPAAPVLLWFASMTLRLVLAAYGLENVRPYRVDSGRNNEHWYVGAGLVLRRYGPFRFDAAIDYEHAILGQLRERGWPVAVPIPSDVGRLVVVDDGRRYSLFPRLA